MRALSLFLCLANGAFAAGSAADLARDIREGSLDPDECYRVRELTLAREDARLYFTDGYLIFAKPVGKTPVSAVFSGDVEGGDGEVLLMPPDRSERRSLAAYTGSPTLDEHFSGAVLTFSDDTYKVLVEQIRANPFNRKSPEQGLLLVDKWGGAARNISSGYQTRIVLDLLSGDGQNGFFTAAIVGKTLGNFDLTYDPRGEEQIALGQLAYRDNRAFVDIWCSFQARSFRNRVRTRHPEFLLSDYRIDAALDADLLMHVRTKARLKPQTRESALPFEVSRQMKILAVSVDGRPAEVLQRETVRTAISRYGGNDLFVVVPDGPLEAGRDYEIEFEHEGKVVSEAGNNVYSVGSRASWYPNRGLQFATYDLTFRYPKDLDLVTPGDIVESRAEGEWRQTRRRTTTPIRMAGFNLGVYERSRVSRDGYSVEVCANRSLEPSLQPRIPEPVLIPANPWPRSRKPPEVVRLPVEVQAPNPAARLRELASETASALEFMAARFGPPALRSLTVSPVPGTFGQGFPGLIYLSTLAYLSPDDKPMRSLKERQQMFFTDILHAHEIAHQWWGNVVTPASYHDDWLMEALANYSALLYVEKRKGGQAVTTMLDGYRLNLLASNGGGETVEALGPLVLGSRLESSIAPDAWRTIIYGKGSWILHMLRRRMGDEAFLKMLGELRRRYEWKEISTEDFRLLASAYLPPKSADSKLETFFDQWVYGTGVPQFKLSYSLKGKAPAVKLTGKLTQSEVDEDFSVPMPVEIQFGRGKALTRWVSSANEPVTFTVTLRQAPTKVLLDPNWSVLRR